MRTKKLRKQLKEDIEVLDRLLEMDKDGKLVSGDTETLKEQRRNLVFTYNYYSEPSEYIE